MNSLCCDFVRNFFVFVSTKTKTTDFFLFDLEFVITVNLLINLRFQMIVYFEYIELSCLVLLFCFLSFRFRLFVRSSNVCVSLCFLHQFIHSKEQCRKKSQLRSMNVCFLTLVNNVNISLFDVFD